MPGDFDFDPSNSSLNIGIELEYPGMDRGDERFINRGRDTSGLQSDVGSIPVAGRAVYDGTVGLEIVSDVLDLEDAPHWYADAIDHIEAEYGVEHQPTGLMEHGSTAGLHIHLSELSNWKARELYELSQTPWAKVLFCSSIATGTDAVAWPVFRGGRHCRMEYGGSRYSVVNSRGRGHYEWRLPEPMSREHLEVLVRFLRLFEQDTEEAIRYAQEILDDADERITAVKRAEAVGIDIEGMPTIEREAAEQDPEHFYDEVSSEPFLPQIFRVDYRGTQFYTFETQMQNVDFEYAGVQFSDDSVLRADTLEHVVDESLRDDIRRALDRRGSEDTRETEATQELKKIIKKKKGK
jgi:hypothetical protein